MKHLFKSFVFGIALGLSTFSAQAQKIGGIGIQFDQMPTGTQAYYEHSDGSSWTDVYAGKKRGKYVVNRYKGKRTSGRKISVRLYDANGRLVSFTGYGSRADKYTLTFKPYSCEFQLGNCTNKRIFYGPAYENNGETETWQVETVKVKGKAKGVYRSIYSKPRTGKVSGGVVFALGKYNLRLLRHFGKSSIELKSLK